MVRRDLVPHREAPLFRSEALWLIPYPRPGPNPGMPACFPVPCRFTLPPPPLMALGFGRPALPSRGELAFRGGPLGFPPSPTLLRCNIFNFRSCNGVLAVPRSDSLRDVRLVRGPGRTT